MEKSAGDASEAESKPAVKDGAAAAITAEARPEASAAMATEALAPTTADAAAVDKDGGEPRNTCA